MENENNLHEKNLIESIHEAEDIINEIRLYIENRNKSQSENDIRSRINALPFSIKSLLLIADRLSQMFNIEIITFFEVELASNLLEVTMLTIFSHSHIQIETFSNKVLNLDIANYRSEIKSIYMYWIHSIWNRCNTLKTAGFLFRLIYGYTSIGDYALRYYCRFLKKLNKSTLKKNSYEYQVDLKSKILRLYIQYLKYSSLLFCLMGGHGIESEDLIIFMYNIRPNISHKDLFNCTMAFNYLNEYLLLPQYQYLVSSCEDIRNNYQSLDLKVRTALSDLPSGLLIEAQLWARLDMKGYEQSALAALIWLYRAFKQNDALKTIVENFSDSLSEIVTPLWFREITAYDLFNENIISNNNISEELKEWHIIYRKLFSEYYMNLDIPYFYLNYQEEICCPYKSILAQKMIEEERISDSLCMSLGSDFINNHFIHNEIKGQEGNPIFDRFSELRNGMIQGYSDYLDKKDLDNFGQRNEIFWGGNINSIKYEEMKRDILEDIIIYSCDKFNDKYIHNNQIEKLLLFLKKHNIDLLYVGFFYSGLGALYIPASGKSKESKFSLINNYNRWLYSSFVSSVWERMRNNDNNAYKDIVQSARTIINEIRDFPWKQGVAVILDSPLQYLPILPILNVEVLADHNSWGVMLDWKSEPSEIQIITEKSVHPYIVLNNFAACFLDDEKNSIYMKKEIDWKQIGLSGEISVNPTTEELVNTIKSKADVIHISTHGYYDQVHPIFSGLMTYNKLSQSKFFPDFVFNAELLNIHIESSLVILSACSTAPGGCFESPYDFSLANIILRNGAVSILGTLWDVYSDVSSEFFYEYRNALRNKSESIAKAYSSAIKAISNNRKSELWASFHFTAKPDSRAFLPIKIP